jgi:signal transduction histidine kinase
MGDSINGLGLAIVNRIMDLHHGSIMVESEVGKGSIFRLLLPLDAQSSHKNDSTPKSHHIAH